MIVRQVYAKLNNWIGRIGSLLLAGCAFPAVIDVIKTGNGNGYDGTFIGMWVGGEILCLIYTLNQEKRLYPLILNYIVNIILISIIVFYKL